MERFAGKKWKDIEENDNKELLENAICRDCRVGSPLLNGEGMVVFAETLAVMGSVCDGVIKVDDEAVLYNPCMGNNGEPISQKELDAMFEEYKMGLEDNFEDQIVIRQIKNVFDSHFILGHLKDVFCRQSVCFMPLGQIIYW